MVGVSRVRIRGRRKGELPPDLCDAINPYQYCLSKPSTVLFVPEVICPVLTFLAIKAPGADVDITLYITSFTKPNQRRSSKSCVTSGIWLNVKKSCQNAILYVDIPALYSNVL
ncbi:hypothetical protein LOAG_12244, partial [Loa loa]